ncbi:phosphatidylglycerol lysyltransferase domain-containing protein [Phenylobacterium aquaticum]|uniref:phosphatidylglycerol lysyltransferase domain-containing protein n=1 Tax=Phenylobacterium aquaticum TaxID=1763816 RepID=UPI001F5DBFDD|nr:bifunctional lysylphosphatidylglycerol flippase/synthetase MprF [Phenylobacterium aquaticum]MCI3132436.1 bifunctional lysylphosphatidylglycerol flippase/synthetase MprF [Phenylobacterium aquaticum]
MRLWSELKPALFAAAPFVGAALTLAAGVMLLISGATPSVPDHFMVVWDHTPAFLIETSHFLSSVMGLALVMLAFGLRARLGGAWVATMAALLVAAPLALLKGFVWEESTALLVLALLLSPFRAAFPRESQLTRMEITPGWLFSAFAVLLGAGLVGVWSFQHADYGDQPFWKTMVDADAARSMRAWGGSAIALFAFGIWRLLATAATPKITGEADPDFHKVRAILASAEAAEPGSNLALLGDKRFLFSATGDSFLMFGVRGRSWIALGAPVGKRSERLELLWRFRELADSHAARCGIYGIGADDLPDVVELGFSIQKVGESAAVPLDSFQIEGRKRGNLRRAWRKAGEEGATFEIVHPPRVGEILSELAAISEAWLANHAGGEKGFSMGGFHPGYVVEFPVAVVRFEGRIVAFATLWTTAARTSFSMDLMRYADDAPKNIMDYLFVELIAWGRTQGYQAFEFGMAPLAGLEDRPLAPILSRVGHMFFERGEDLYNFQGVRRYKDKYDPLWQPRYIAAPRKWTIPFLLADVGLLSSGGVAGLAKRPKKTEDAPALQQAA